MQTLEFRQAFYTEPTGQFVDLRRVLELSDRVHLHVPMKIRQGALVIHLNELTWDDDEQKYIVTEPLQKFNDFAAMMASVQLWIDSGWEIWKTIP